MKDERRKMLLPNFNIGLALSIGVGFSPPYNKETIPMALAKT
ncbi:hypothetical protein [Chryseobacterium lactis]|nr:hypothetical protein [Chryseobacterium lactis]